MATPFPDPAALDRDAWTPSIDVEIADGPLPVRARIEGVRLRMTTGVRRERPHLPSLPAASPILPVIGVSALAKLLVRGRRRPG